MKHLRDIEAWLNRKTGLDANLIGQNAVVHAVRRRQSEQKLSDDGEYWTQVQRSESESARLIDEVIVPETWFFRDLKPFQFLAEYVTRNWLPANPMTRLRVLSAPCATGEEPYSIAMTLLDCGLPAASLAIDAVDISERLLNLARRAVYRPNSFRLVDPVIRSRYFQKTENGEFRLSSAVQACVHFSQGNLVDPDFSQHRQRYHIIFCRNLMIYLDAKARTELLENLDGLLADEGMLCVGHAEANTAVASRFRSSNSLHSFSFFKPGRRRRSTETAGNTWASPRAGRPEPPASEAGTPSSRAKEKVTPATPDASKLDRVSSKVSAAPPLPPGSPKLKAATNKAEAQSLPAAVELANAGRLKEAATLCAQYLKDHGASAEGFFLLGVVCVAQGNKPEAEDFFKKAVYLEPGHSEAMIHLALLAESRGDRNAAHRWRKRAERIQAEQSAA